MKKFLTIIIPAYNEEENFKKGALVKVVSYLKNFPYSYELLIVDDGSFDNSKRLIKNFIKNKKNWQLIENPHQGKAATIASGVKIANGSYILFTDFDQATPLSELKKMLPLLKKSYDIAIGSREIKGAKREKEPFHRHLMGKVFNFVVKILAFGGIQDTQCGFKLFKKEVAKELFNSLKVYKPYKPELISNAFTGAFDVELLFLAKKKGFKIAEVPVFWQHYKTSRVNPIKDSIRMFVDVVKIRLNDFLGNYEK